MAQVNPNHLLTRSLAATYLNRIASTKNARIPAQVKEIIETTRLPTDRLGENSEGEVTAALLQTIEWLERCSSDIHIDVSDVESKIKSFCGYENIFMEIFRESIPEDLESPKVSLKLNAISSEIAHELNLRRLQKVVATYNRKVNFETEHVDGEQIIHELVEQLTTIGQMSNDQEKVGFGGRIDTTDEAQIETYLEKAADLSSDEGVLRTGLQGLNRMWGIGGNRRGESVCFGGLTHHFKSGMLLAYSRWLPIYNKPHMIDKQKKPLILRVTFENKLEQDILILYKSLFEQKYRKKVDVKNIPIKEAAAFIKEELGVNGYTFVVEAYDPNNFNIWDLIDIIAYWEARGYEVHAIIPDYLELITRSEAKKTRQDQAINTAFEVLRNHCFPRGILQVNCHQLSTEAQKIAREGSTATFAKRISTGSYWMNSQSLSTKHDGECILYLHKTGEGDESRTFLMFGRGKHRNGEDTPEKHRYFGYEMEKIGGLIDDVDGECQAIYDMSRVLASQSADLGNSEFGGDDFGDSDGWTH